MPTQTSILTKAKSGYPSLLLNAVGEDVEIMGSTELQVNGMVKARLYQLHATIGELPQEEGHLRFLPISDDACSLELILFRNTDNDDVAEALFVAFHPTFMLQWSLQTIMNEPAFRKFESTSRAFDVNQGIREAANSLCANLDPKESLQHSLRQTEVALRLLRKVTDAINMPFTACPVPACRFLAYESERLKIFEAQQIIDDRYDENLSIKELSRAVAINECYLKKGFKTLVGKTIHEYRLGRRIEKARELLQDGKSVTEVAAILGYSSISHFSTAFKKATGLKPCELL